MRSEIRPMYVLYLQIGSLSGPLFTLRSHPQKMWTVFGHFGHLALLNKTYLVIFTWHLAKNTPPSPFHVHMVYGWPLTKTYLLLYSAEFIFTLKSWYIFIYCIILFYYISRVCDLGAPTLRLKFNWYEADFRLNLKPK